MNANITKFEKKLKVKIQNKKLLVQALTHKSSNKKVNNEKLEFLGDRVIGLILSKKLLDLYPNDDEGILDKKFAKLVNRKTCALIAWNVGLGDFIVTGNIKRNISLKDEKILSDACEALIGAVYVDQGFDYVQSFVLRLWQNDIKKSYLTILDPKTMLQEYSLKLYKKLPVYNLISYTGPKHNPVFKVSVYIKGSKHFIGKGKSKKLAEQDCANNLLKTINRN